MLRFKGGEEKSAVTGDVAIIWADAVRVHVREGRENVSRREGGVVWVVGRPSGESVEGWAVRRRSVYLGESKRRCRDDSEDS